jgi:hypothetical protein
MVQTALNIIVKKIRKAFGLTTVTQSLFSCSKNL